MEHYTPGYSPLVTSFMARRTLSSHGGFFRPFLWPGARVLDCGCGPGSITRGIAACVAPGGSVTAIDACPQELEAVPGVEFRTASIYDLPFADNRFDAVFSHALFEHLAQPERAAKQVFRVLKPGGFAGVRSPDWGGFLAGPPTPQLDLALEHYAELQASNGGNLRIGRMLPSILAGAGFSRLRFSAAYECYQPVSIIGEYLAQQSTGEDAATLRAWHTSPHAFFAQAWCEVIARK